MAEDSNKPNNNSQEIDLDNIEVEVLIICKNQPALNSAASFLTRRGWPTTVVTDISRAVEQIADKRPDFVLISLSHPSTTINKLPDLITQTFNIQCVGFIETSDSASSNKFNQSRIRYKIQGQPSGPAIHRTLRKILAERFHIETGEDANNSPSGGMGHDESTTRRISGQSGMAADGGVIIQKNSASIMSGSKNTHVRGDAGSGEKSALSEGSVGTFFKKSSGAAGESEEKSAEYSAEITQNEIDALVNKEPAKPAKKRMSLKQLEGEQLNPIATPAAGDMLFGQTLDRNRKAYEAQISNEELVNEMKKSLFGESGEELTASLSAPEVTAPSLPPQEATSENTSAARTAEEPFQPRDRSGQTQLEIAVEGAMNRVCQTIPDTIPLRMEELGSVGICALDSTESPGYLIIVWQAPDQIAREEFLRNCEAELQNALVAMNVQGKFEPGFWAQLPAAAFETLADHHAKFKFILAHQKREVGVAFFPVEGSLAKASPPAGDHGMYSVKVDQISTEFPVTFKAFIHFLNNNRFFLYLRNGRVLQPEQKQRLQESKISDFYMNSSDVENLRRYMAITYLGGLINRLKERLKASA